MQSKRRKELEQAFEEIDVNHDNLLSQQELFSFLDLRNGGVQYDREIANQIFERMDINQDGEVTIQEFISIFIEAEEILNEKIKIAEENIKNFESEMSKVESDLMSSKKEENINEYG